MRSSDCALALCLRKAICFTRRAPVLQLPDLLKTSTRSIGRQCYLNCRKLFVLP